MTPLHGTHPAGERGITAFGEIGTGFGEMTQQEICRRR
jgi:hypothetical protein